jgi:hypothetical protein
MTNRRTFLGGMLTVAAGIAIDHGMQVASQLPAMVEFYPVNPTDPRLVDGGLFSANFAEIAGKPLGVRIQRVQVGHFYGLAHEGEGRIAYLYEATLKGPTPRRGLVKIDENRVGALA